MNPSVAAPPVSPSAGADLATWRTRLLDRLLTVVIIAGWLVGLPSIVLAVAGQLWLLVGADIVALLWVTWLYRARTMPPRQRALHLLSLLYLISVVLLVTIGHASQIYLMALPILAVLLVSLRAAIVGLVLSALTLLLIGYLTQADTGMPGAHDYPLLRWGAITLNFLLIDTALTVACAFLLRGMEGALREQQANAALLQHQALHDALTGLANRRLLHDRVGQAIAHARRSQGLVGVLLLDLDGFKNVNDSHGHDLGDELISAAAGRLSEAVRAGDTVARLGGDEFVVLLGNVANEAELIAAVERVQLAVSGVYHLPRHQLHVTASVGVAVYPRDGDNAASLLKNADTAMYRAKEGGRNRFQCYEAAMNARLAQRLALEGELRGALARGELQLYYQPRVAADDRRALGAEALLRWQHPTLGMVTPAQFIPIAEDTGLILPIGAWVLDTAARQLAEWQREFPGLCLSVNLSARQFRDPDLQAQIAAAAAHVAPETLEVEVTESLVMHQLDAAQRVLAAVRHVGVGVAMDDFGTGYSSLAQLKALPLDVLKIDRSFVSMLDAEAQDRAIVQTIVALAGNLKLVTVAEGVETEAQALALRALGVDQLQGYLLAKPLPVEEFRAWLRAR